jgi:hypothetical protein
MRGLFLPEAGAASGALSLFALLIAIILLEPISLMHKGKFASSTAFACAMPQSCVRACDVALQHANRD